MTENSKKMEKALNSRLVMLVANHKTKDIIIQLIAVLVQSGDTDNEIWAGRLRDIL